MPEPKPSSDWTLCELKDTRDINRAPHQYSGPALQQALGEVSTDMIAHY